MNNNIMVTKRNGRGKEAFDLEKVHKVLEWATKDVANVSISEIELRSNIQLYDGIKAYDIHELLIKSGFFYSSEMAPVVKRNIRSLFNRASLTHQDLRTLHGIIRSLSGTSNRT